MWCGAVQWGGVGCSGVVWHSAVGWGAVVWCGVCGVICDQLIGSYIFPRFTSDINTNFLQDELPALLHNVLLQTWQKTYYQQFIYCNLKTHNSWTVANWTHIYVFDPESALELNPAVLTITPGTTCIAIIDYAPPPKSLYW
jgi:hypothetical protein